MSALLNAAIKGAIEGITEFLPISSTGHLVLARSWFPLIDGPATPEQLERIDNLFDIVVQFPAILAVVIMFRARLFKVAATLGSRPESRRFCGGVLLAFFPAAVAALLLQKTIERHLLHPVPVALALIVGGVILLLVDRGTDNGKVEKAEDVSLPQSLSIGLFQCLALMPGTSRSAATIIGGRLAGLTRTAAAEFSFFLAIPTLFGAFVYKFAKGYKTLDMQHDVPLLVVGSLVSFITAWIFVGWFIRFLEKHSMAVFGYYRIILGALVLLLVA